MNDTEKRITSGLGTILKWIGILIAGAVILYFGRGVFAGIGRYLIPVFAFIWLAFILGKPSKSKPVDK